MKRFQNILVALDTRFEKQPPLEWATRLVARTGARLKLVDVVPDVSWLARQVIPSAEDMHDALAEEKRQSLERIAKPLRDGGIEVETGVLNGKTSVEIIHEVMKSDHDLVLRVTKGAHSKNTGFFGTTSMRLLRRCPCAVWLIRPDAPIRCKRVMAAVDPTSNDDAHTKMNSMVMELGMSIAEYESSEFHVAHAWELFGSGVVKSRLAPGEFEQIEHSAEAQVAEKLDRFLTPHGLSHQSENVHLLRDEIGAGHAIPELAKVKEFDLIVMGTIARTGVSGALMGNTAERVLDQVQCSVLTIKPDGFISPVDG